MMLEFTEAFKYLKDNTEELTIEYKLESDGVGYWTCEAYLSREDLDPDNFRYCIHIGIGADDTYEASNDTVVETMQFAVVNTQHRFQIAVEALAAKGIPTREKVEAAWNDLYKQKIYNPKDVIEALYANQHFNHEWIEEHAEHVIESLRIKLEKKGEIS